jgi:hypothetical protein
MGGKFRAQIDQCFSFLLRQGGAQVGFVCRGDRLNLLEKVSPFLAQLQLLVPAVLWAALPRNQAFRPEFVK